MARTKSSRKNSEMRSFILIAFCALALALILAYVFKNNKAQAPAVAVEGSDLGAQLIPGAEIQRPNINPSQLQRRCIAGEAPWIKVINPDGGEVFHAGQQVEIKWTSCGILSGTPVFISLARGGHDMGLLTVNGTTNDGSEVITLGSSLSIGSMYRIGIDVGTGAPIGDTSDDYFSILPAQGAFFGEVVSLAPNVMAVTWYYETSYEKHWVYAVYTWANGAWRRDYISAPQVLGGGIKVSKLSNNVALVAFNEAGAGTATSWGVLYKSGPVSYALKSGDMVRNQALQQAGLIYMGYNGVSVVNGKIVEILPGYVQGDARCCPTGQGKTATYGWDASRKTIYLISVQ